MSLGPACDLFNAGLARVEPVTDGVMAVSSLTDGSIHELRGRDRMLERFDLAYCLNAHIAQGGTTAHGIVMMSASEPKLASGKTLLVSMTRIADQATLIVDSGHGLERAVVRNPGTKTSALDVAAALPSNELSLNESRPERGGFGISTWTCDRVPAPLDRGPALLPAVASCQKPRSTLLDRLFGRI